MLTPICEAIGIDYPVFQSGMGMIARAELAGAVSEAEGLGIFGADLKLLPEEMREQIRAVRALTAKPFADDILFATIRAEGGEVVKYTDEIRGLIEVTLDERVAVLIAALGSPKGAVKDAHARGIYVLSVVGAVRHAQKAVADGGDAIIASGHDGGGHVGKVGTSVLVPAIADAVDVPVLAGGGSADGRGLAAALMWGAHGVWLGARFIATAEAGAHDNYKNKIVAADASGTVVTRAHSGKPCRMFRNAFTDYWAEHESDIEPYPLQAIRVGNTASSRGRIDGDVVHDVVNEARRALARATGSFQPATDSPDS